MIRMRLLGLAAAAFLIVFLLRPRPVPPVEIPPPVPLTFDSGLTGWPSLSGDGHLLVYASDRAGGNLDLYSQQRPGGSPVRLTATPEDEWEPSLSPTGGNVAFRWEKAGGGIYVMVLPQGEPRLLAAGGHHPRWSADGKWLAYWSNAGIFVVAASGGEPRSLVPGAAVRSPAWSPDGRALAFVDDGKVRRIEVSGGATSEMGLNGAIDDLNWTAQGLVFSMRDGWVRNLYRCAMDSERRVSGALTRVTTGTQVVSDAAASTNGEVVFAAGAERYDVWAIPVDAHGHTSIGPASRITDNLAPVERPQISGDGRHLLFESLRNGIEQTWSKDLVTGAEAVIGGHPAPVQADARYQIQRATPSGSITIDGIEVYRPPSARLSLSRVNPGSQHISVVPGKLIVLMSDTTSNAWMIDVAPGRR